MKVQVLQSFTGYPDGKRTVFAVGPATLTKKFVEESDLIGKGLVASLKTLTPPDPE